MKVTVLGTGGWGLSLGQVVYENKNEVMFWTNSQAEVDLLSTEHQYKDKLPGVIFPADFKYTTDMNAALEGCEMVLIVVPSQFMGGVAKTLASGRRPRARNRWLFVRRRVFSKERTS
jgi:glycerol-3-phosphate dehydrogenase (NAD(P)+)